jgi:hypothetical protein
MPIELAKSQKKVARELIDKSLQIECKQFIEETETLIDKQKREEKSSHETYLKLYKDVKTFDKHIARRYDDLTGSRYILVLLGLLHDEILTKEDLNRFDEDVREYLLNATRLWDDGSK